MPYLSMIPITAAIPALTGPLGVLSYENNDAQVIQLIQIADPLHLTGAKYVSFSPREGAVETGP